MNGLKSAIAVVLSLMALAAALAKFDKLPGVHLDDGKGKFRLGFGAKEPERASRAKEPDQGPDTKAAHAAKEGVEQEEVSKGKTEAARTTKIEGLQLHGLFHTGRRALAIINNETFAQGDVASVDFRGEKLPLRCVEIRTNSVVVMVSNITGTVQLFLPKDVGVLSPRRGSE